MIGSQLGSYEILEEIGRGGMGAVYKARQPSLDRIVAVKVLLPQLAADEVFVERFLREARSIATLEHQGIVTVYDVGEADGTYYFAMQLLDGQPLDEILEDGKPLPLKTALEIARQVARALQFAHESKILHRDVKPGNIIVSESGGAVLTDFGIAKAMSDTSLTKTGTSIGSPEYMAPEQIEGKTLDARADLYALGVVMYQMLVGQVPYQGESAVSIVYQHVKSPVPSAREANANVPELVDQVVATLMAKDPEERFSSARALLDGLDGKEFAKGAKEPSGGIAALPKWIWGAAAGVVALAGILAMTLGGEPVPESPAETQEAQLEAPAAEPEETVEEVETPAATAAPPVAEPAPEVPAAPEPRTLRITSEPPGATVTLNGEQLAGKTPTSADFLPETRYDLQLRLSGHEGAGWTFNLASLSSSQNSSSTLHFPLKSSVPPGVLSIAADYNVRVQIGGRTFNSKRIEMPPGTYTARITAPEVFLSQSRQVTLSSGSTEEIQLPIAVPLKLGANPSRCRVKINGMDAGYVPADIRITVGQHRFEFDWEGIGESLLLSRRITTRTDRVFATAPR